MKALLFNGAPERKPQSTSDLIAQYLSEKLEALNVETSIFNIVDSDIPMLDFTLSEVPTSVKVMAKAFQEADLHIWLSPLYHGSIPGAMKNCLDWMEITAKNPVPYLTDKTVGLVCWADGAQAMQGINTMDAISKALRAWTLPYSIPIVRGNLFEAEHPTEITPAYKTKLDLLAQIGCSKKITSL